jgi:hypothetical protein
LATVSYLAPRSALVAFGALLLVACSSVQGEPIEIPAPDMHAFELDVYPVMLRDCGFVGCHGDPYRFFRVFGPGRTRLLADTLPYDPATQEEIRQTYDRARSMLSAGTEVYESLLLRKPLAKSAGGAEHQGSDQFGHNVYQVTSEPAYQTLLRWALSAPVASNSGAAP